MPYQMEFIYQINLIGHCSKIETKRIQNTYFEVSVDGRLVDCKWIYLFDKNENMSNVNARLHMNLYRNSTRTAASLHFDLGDVRVSSV